MHFTDFSIKHWTEFVTRNAIKAENRLPEKTTEKHTNRWQKGQSGNPAGRPKGSKHKLAEEFLRDLTTVWSEMGIDCIRQMAEKRPGDFVRVCASLIPKEFHVKDKSLQEMSNQEIDDFIVLLRSQLIGDNAQVIDGNALPCPVQR